MYKIVRLVFRFDYTVKFDIMDNLGKMLGVLHSSDPEIWQEVGESRANRSLSARYSNTKLKTEGQLNVDINNINGTIDFPQGATWHSDQLQDFLQHCSRACKEIMDSFHISTLNRAGIRFFVFEYDDIIKNNSRIAFNALTNHNLLSAFEDLGNVNDLGVVYEGVTKSNVSYRMIFGPGSEADLAKILQKNIPDEQLGERHQICADIDLYENHISFAGLNLDKWAKTKWPTAEKMLGMVKKRILDACAKN